MGLLSWDKAVENEFTFACHLANKLEIKVLWELFNEYTISATPSITLHTFSIKAGLQLKIRILGEQVLVKCLSIDMAGFITNTTDQCRLHSLQIDGQACSPGLQSLREAITTTYGAAVWLSQLPGFPSARPAKDVVDDQLARGASSGEGSDEVTNLTLPDDQDEDEEISDEAPGNPDLPTKGWTKLKPARLNDGSHGVIELVMGSSSATSGDIQIGEELTHVDDIKVNNLPTESIEILLSGPPDSDVHLYLISLGGVGRDVFLTRIAWDKPSISWSRAVLPLRMRRLELERPKLPLNGPAAPVRSES